MSLMEDVVENAVEDASQLSGLTLPYIHILAVAQSSPFKLLQLPKRLAA